MRQVPAEVSFVMKEIASLLAWVSARLVFFAVEILILPGLLLAYISRLK